MRNYFSYRRRKSTEELLDISKQQNKGEESKKVRKLLALPLLKKANDLFASMSQGIQVPSLWLLYK